MPAEVMPEKSFQGIHAQETEISPIFCRRLEGKIAIVTGGAGGIGSATVSLFVKHGAKVVIADINDQAGLTLASLLSPFVTYVHCDVSLETEVQSLIDSTISRYGRVDIMFTNAGVLGNQSKHKSIVNFNVDEFDKVMSVNVRGVALGMKHVARVMIPNKTGCIISTASVASVMGGMGPHAYTASKHAIVGLTKNVACELGKYGIRVNCISPFGVATSMLVNAWRNEDEDGCFVNFRLEGNIAIVTGGAGGIGSATVSLFVKHGAKVVIADINDQAGLTLASSLSPFVTYVHCDVSLETEVQSLIDSTISRYGRVDIMFTNAGVLGNQSKHKSIVNFNVDEFDKVMSVNVRGVALGMKHAARVMIPNKTGCIISTASVASVMGGMGPHAYTALKHAIVGLTKNAACELGKYGIRVNCISPFGVATSMLVNAWRNEDEDEHGVLSFRRPNEKEIEKMEKFVSGLGNLKGTTLSIKDIAEAALYLASDESRYVSGHNLVVDGAVTTTKNCVNL